MGNGFILVWNHTLGDFCDDYDALVRRTERGRASPVLRWRLGSRKGGIARGDTALLFRSHSQRGLIGVGTFTSEVDSRRRRDGSGRLANAIEFRLSRLVAAEDRVPVESLLRHVPEVPWNGLQGSGAQVKEQALAKVFKLWDARGERGLAAPEELVESDRFEEGAVVQVRANRYERDWGAREACIARWGTTCAACGFDFEKVYGTIGKGFIHVHHLRDLALIGRRYEVDPEKDLRPLCANCHAMIHRERPAMPLESLKRRLASASKKAGGT